MVLPKNKTARAAGCLALALALPFGVTGCATTQNGQDQTPAAEASANTAEKGQETPVEADERVATVAYYDGTSAEPITATYTYDEAGRLTSAEDSTMSQKWSYDEAGRLVKEETTYAADEESKGGEQNATYTYDEDGTLVERILEDTTDEMLDYETGEPITDPDTGAVMDDYKRTYTYEDDGKKMTVTVTNTDGQWIGETVSYFDQSAKGLFPTVSTEPDELGAVIDPWKPVKEETVDQDGTVLESAEYTYNEAGDVVTVASSYDDEEGSEKIVWTTTYDDKGNEASTSVSIEGSDEEAQEIPTEWTYDESGRPIEKMAFDPFFGTTYEFYTYDSAGRLKTITFAQPQEGAEALVGCQVYTYVEGNEEPAQTPDELIAEAKAKVPVEEATEEDSELALEDDELALEDGEEIALDDLEELDLENLDLEGIEVEDDPDAEAA